MSVSNKQQKRCRDCRHYHATHPKDDVPKRSHWCCKYGADAKKVQGRCLQENGKEPNDTKPI